MEIFHWFNRYRYHQYSNGFPDFIRTARIIITIIVIAICTLPVQAESFDQKIIHEKSNNATEGYNPATSMKETVLSYFYPVSDKISAIEEGLAQVNFRSSMRLRKGMRFSVFREGEPYYHPVTKKLIGKSEEFIGRIEILKEEKGSYICTIITGSPRAGDLVRVTSSRIKLAFFQDREADWTLSEMFYYSLKDSGRFEFMETYTKDYTPEKLAVLARKLGAEVILFFSTPIKDKNIFLNAKLFWAEDAAVLAEIEEIFRADSEKELTFQHDLTSGNYAEGKFWESHKLAGGELIAVGDVDGNDKRELIVSDGNSIRIYRYKPELQEIWFIKGIPNEKIIHIGVLDVNKNGRAEIFVASLKDMKMMSSFVLEYDQSGGYKRIWDKAPYVFRVIGETLLMQSFTPFKTFTGPVYTVKLSEGQYLADKPLELPSGVNIYGFTYVDWKKRGTSYIFAFDDDGHLKLYNNNEVLWTSEESFGEFELSFDDNSNLLTESDEWFVKGRLITVETKRGQEVIVVKKVPFLPGVPGLGHKKTEVYSFWWNDTAMDKTLILDGINGTVTDYWAERNDLLLITRPNIIMFLQKSLSGDFKKGSILYYYRRI